MIMIWSGFGFLVVVIVFGFSLAVNLAADAWLGAGYYAEHKWPFAVGLLLSAVACWFIGLALQRRGSRVVIDKATGREFELRRNHRFFFIPIHIWGIVLAVAGLVVPGVGPFWDQVN